MPGWLQCRGPVLGSVEAVLMALIARNFSGRRGGTHCAGGRSGFDRLLLPRFGQSLLLALVFERNVAIDFLAGAAPLVRRTIVCHIVSLRYAVAR